MHLGLQFWWLKFAKVIEMSFPMQEPSTWPIQYYAMGKLSQNAFVLVEVL